MGRFEPLKIRPTVARCAARAWIELRKCRYKIGNGYHPRELMIKERRKAMDGDITRLALDATDMAEDSAFLFSG